MIASLSPPAVLGRVVRTHTAVCSPYFVRCIASPYRLLLSPESCLPGAYGLLLLSLTDCLLPIDLLPYQSPPISFFHCSIVSGRLIIHPPPELYMSTVTCNSAALHLPTAVQRWHRPSSDLLPWSRRRQAGLALSWRLFLFLLLILILVLVLSLRQLLWLDSRHSTLDRFVLLATSWTVRLGLLDISLLVSYRLQAG